MRYSYYFLTEGIQIGGKCSHFTDKSQTQGWSNMFALNYEVGFTHKFDIDNETFRATGCPGLELEDRYAEDFPANKVDVIELIPQDRYLGRRHPLQLSVHEPSRTMRQARLGRGDRNTGLRHSPGVCR